MHWKTRKQNKTKQKQTKKNKPSNTENQNLWKITVGALTDVDSKVLGLLGSAPIGCSFVACAIVPL